MSIPKDPRQLMINMMYLVLTALLALNVSAEIMNAFFIVEKGLNRSQEIVGLTNNTIFSNIEHQANTYEEYTPLYESSMQARSIANKLFDEIEAIKHAIVEAAGGLDEAGIPKRKNDKDIPTRLMVSEGKANQLKASIKSTREQLLSLIEDEHIRKVIAQNIPLNVPASPDGSDWATYTFNQMPVGAVLPILSKFQNDIRSAETTFLNHFLAQTATELIFDEFEPVITTKSAFVFTGEPYEADVFLSARSTQVENMDIRINGRNYSVSDGKARYSSVQGEPGRKKYTVQIGPTNPLTNVRKIYEKTFQYEVGEQSMAVSASKMNVFYIGVDNPVEVSVGGVMSDKINVSIDGAGGSISKSGNGQYTVNVSSPGQCNINVDAGSVKGSRLFRVKRIPDPIAKLGGRSMGGIMNPGPFRAQEGIIAILENFDFNARCNVVSFEMARVPKNQDPTIVENQGGKFSERASQIVRLAAPGDYYFFSEIRAKCPGDRASRKINSMAFTIR